MKESKPVALDKLLKERLVGDMINAMIIGIIVPILIKTEGELLSSSIISLIGIYGAVIKIPQKYISELPIKLAIYMPVYILLLYIFVIPLILINIKYFIIIDLIFLSLTNIFYFNRQQIFNEALKNNYEDFSLHNFSNEQVSFVAIGSVLGYLINIVVTYYYQNNVILFVTIIISYIQLYWILKFNRYIISMYNNRHNISDKS